MLKQRGVTLLEMIVALGIMASLAALVATQIDDTSRDTKSAVTALHGKTIAEAGNKYVKDNFASITTVATATTPALIRVSDLVTAGYLNAGYSSTNARRQTACILVLQPTANKLNGLLVYEGGDTIDDLTLGQIAAFVGGAGGGIYSTNTTTVRGAMGGYNLPIGNFANANHLNQKCDGTSGAITLAAGRPAVALWMADTASSSPTLYRDEVPGNPSLNTMNTPILIGAGAVQTTGAACTPNGALARDATGGVVSCVSGQWRAAGGSQYWQDPVATFALLPACNASTINQTRVVEVPTVGSGRRAYTCNGIGTWNALGVDNSGNLTVAGNASINALSVTSNSILGDTNSDTVTVNGTSTFNSGLTVGDGTAATATNTLVVNRTATTGGACSPNGAMARDSAGKILSCQTSIWKDAFGNTLNAIGSDFINRFGYWATDNDFVQLQTAVSACTSASYPAYPTCPAGYSSVANRRYTGVTSCTFGSITSNTTRYYSQTSCLVN